MIIFNEKTLDALNDIDRIKEVEEIVENVLGLEEGYLGKNDSIPEIIMLNRK